MEEVAQQFGVTYQLIYRLVRTGELPALRIGKGYRITEQDIEAYMLKQREAVQKEARSMTCSCCGKAYYSSQSIVGECEECGAPLCMNCVNVKHERFCRDHKK